MLRDIAQKGVKLAVSIKGVTHVEIVLSRGTEDLTRFANNMIHQSVSLTDGFVHVRLGVGTKIGVARTNHIDLEGIKQAIAQAKAIALLQKEDPHFRELPGKSSYRDIQKQYESSAHVGAMGRVNAISTIISKAKTHELSASGAFVESEGELAVANSNGVWAYQQTKSASLSTILMGSLGSGFASKSSKGGSEIKGEEIAQTAVFKATHGAFVDVDPGEYEVILEPPAVAELLDFFAWLGPNARIYHEDVSFYQGNIGNQIFDSAITIYDDPTHEAGYPTGFDMEGFPKKRHTLVDQGTLTQVVYDSYHAGKHNATNTGHALLAPNTFGPIPTHLVIQPGSASVNSMIKNVKRGLLVTRFWYTRVIQQKQLMLTGMTRDGTFYIENGVIVGRVRNLRYTESVVEALKDVRAVGDTLELVGSEGSPSLVPALHLGKFRFTGVTKHG